jgi:hypothetical protein
MDGNMSITWTNSNGGTTGFLSIKIDTSNLPGSQFYIQTWDDSGTLWDYKTFLNYNYTAWASEIITLTNTNTDMFITEKVGDVDTYPPLQSIMAQIQSHRDVDCEWLYGNTLMLSSPSTQTINSTLVQNTSIVGQPFMSRNTTAILESMLYNENDGGGSQLQNLSSPGINEMYVGTNSDGGNNALEDFVEIYAKTTIAQSGGEAEGTGTRVFVCPGSNGGLSINVANVKTWDETGVSKCDHRFTSDGLHVTGGIWLTGEVHPNGSHTITHRTNIVGFKPEQIGCFAESTGELADVTGLIMCPVWTVPPMRL